MISTLVKRGRPVAIHDAANGDRIVGLMRLKDGRWRASGPEKFTFSEPDERLAIARFRQWEARKRGHGTVYFPVPQPKPGGPVEDMPVLTSFDRSNPCQWKATQHVDQAVAWAWVREQILTRPQYVAQMTGIEQIGYLTDLVKPEPSPALEEVGNLYLHHAKVSDNWRAKCKLFWKEFSDCVKVPTLRELTQGHLVGYADTVRKAAETPTYARQRYGAIKAIINYPPKRGKWAVDAKRALHLCSVLVPPKKSAADPQPIPREAFHALLKAADPQMKAVLLLALNCCMYGGEVVALDWADLDLRKGTLATERCKTGIVRVATLWGRTVAVLKKLPRTTEAVFITSGTKMRHNYQTIYKAFKAARKAAALAEADVQFSHVRDGAYTSAIEAGVDITLVRVLAGHATGISDHYVKRRPQMVAPGCAAIEKAYFG